MIHERVGGALHMHWQIPYLPVVAVAAVLWLRVLRALSANAIAVKLWIAGAAAWVGAQTFEILQSLFAPQHEAVDGTVLPLHGAINLHFVFTIMESRGDDRLIPLPVRAADVPALPDRDSPQAAANT